MNWLIYIAGWFWGWGITNAIFCPEDKSNFTLIFKIIIWSMTWIWICWKFI